MEPKQEEYRPPSSFFHEMRDPSERRIQCNRTTCKLCLLTTGLCVGMGFLVNYLIRHWHVFEGIS